LGDTAAGVVMLRISSENPRYFQRNGKLIQLISSGQNGLPGDIVDMKKAGVNCVQMVIPFVKELNLCPFVMGGEYKNNYGGWNEKAFRLMGGFLEMCKKLDLIAEIIIDSLPHLRGPGHILRRMHGGPVPDGVSGGAKRLAYDYNMNTGSWPFQIYQNFLTEFTHRFPLDRYPDVIFTLFWECFTGWRTSKQFIADLVRLINHKEANRVVGIGNWNTNHLEWIRKEIGSPVYGQTEAAHATELKKMLLFHGGKNKRQPVKQNGWWFDDRLFWSQKNTKLKCDVFRPGNERTNAVKTIKQIKVAITRGLNPSLTFESCFNATGYSGKWKCDFRGYDFGLYKSIVYRYLEFIKEVYNERDLLKVTNKDFTIKINGYTAIFLRKEGLN
jgi:hypothetical protein